MTNKIEAPYFIQAQKSYFASSPCYWRKIVGLRVDLLILTEHYAVMREQVRTWNRLTAERPNYDSKKIRGRKLLYAAKAKRSLAEVAVELHTALFNRGSTKVPPPTLDRWGRLTHRSVNA